MRTSTFGLSAICLAASVCALAAPTPMLPLKQVHAGMKGIGRTVFTGTKIENFDVEILGVLENIGPKQSLILARLSGGPLEKTGVMQGMSGSPVYIDGKLVGAVAMAFQFAKEPIAGIRPIEEMLSVPDKAASRGPIRLQDTDLLAALPKQGEAMFGGGKMIDIATPVSFG